MRIPGIVTSLEPFLVLLEGIDDEARPCDQEGYAEKGMRGAVDTSNNRRVWLGQFGAESVSSEVSRQLAELGNSLIEASEVNNHTFEELIDESKEAGKRVDAALSRVDGVAVDAAAAVLAAEAAQQAVKDSASIVRIDSSRGVMFRHNEVSTVLKVSVFKGNRTIENLLDLHEVYGPGAYIEWQWQRYDETAFGTITSADPRVGNGGFTLTLSPSDVETKVVFRAILNGDTI